MKKEASSRSTIDDRAERYSRLCARLQEIVERETWGQMQVEFKAGRFLALEIRETLRLDDTDPSG